MQGKTITTRGAAWSYGYCFAVAVILNRRLIRPYVMLFGGGGGGGGVVVAVVGGDILTAQPPGGPWRLSRVIG